MLTRFGGVSRQIGRGSSIGSTRDSAWLGLIALTALAHFMRVGGYGLYEDDYHYVAYYLDGGFAMVGELAARAFLEWPQGRPLQAIVPPLLTVLLYPLGGLLALYAVAFAITAGTVLLFHRIVLRTTSSPVIALIAAWMFCLFPPDTTHPFLTHALILRLALLCSLAACLRLADRQKIAAYGLAFIGLLFYESPFLIFLGAPLLLERWTTPAGRKALLQHAVVCGLLIGVTILMRWLNGEERITAAHSSLTEIALRLPRQMILGVSVAARQMTYGPIKRIAGWDALSLGLILPAAAVFYLWLRRTMDGAAGNRAVVPVASGIPFQHLLLTAFVLFLLAYLLSFTHKVVVIYGRLTSVHLAAVFGGSLLFALAAYRAAIRSDGRPRNWVSIILALHFAVLFGYRSTIQADFVRSWAMQRWYWTEILEQAPDLVDGTVVLIEGTNMPTTRYIRTYAWSDPLMFDVLFRVPGTWKSLPAALPLFEGIKLGSSGGEPFVDFPDLSRNYPLTPGHVILLEQAGSGLVRRVENTALIQGMQVLLQRPGLPTTVFEKRPLYEILIAAEPRKQQDVP